MDSNVSAEGSKVRQAATSQILTRSNVKQANINDARVKETQRSVEVSPLRRSVAAAEASPQRALKKNGNLSTADLQRALEAIDGGAKIARAKIQDTLTPKELRLKVAQLTQTRPTPFKDGIPGKGWLKWWKRRHPDVASRVLRPSRRRSSGGEDGR